MRKKQSGFFSKKDNTSLTEHERQQIINEVQEQMAEEYKTKFGNMESTLSNLESQSDSITNFNNQQSKNR